MTETKEISPEEMQAILAPYREKLDRIDSMILEQLRDRVRIIETVAEIKKQYGIAVMQHGRVKQINDKLRAYAEANGLSGGYLTELYATIIAESCRIEELVMDRRGKWE